MLKFAVLALLAFVAWRWAFGYWPWQRSNKAGGGNEVAQARRLLGVEPNAGRIDILAAHRRRVARVHPDKGGSAHDVHEADRARDLLLARHASTRGGRKP